MSGDGGIENMRLKGKKWRFGRNPVSAFPPSWFPPGGAPVFVQGVRGRAAAKSTRCRALRVGKGLTVYYLVPENGIHCYLVSEIAIQTPSLA